MGTVPVRSVLYAMIRRKEDILFHRRKRAILKFPPVEIVTSYHTTYLPRSDGRLPLIADFCKKRSSRLGKSPRVLGIGPNKAMFELASKYSRPRSKCSSGGNVPNSSAVLKTMFVIVVPRHTTLFQEQTSYIEVMF